MTPTAAGDTVIRFEVRAGMRRVSCAVSHEALDAASALDADGTPATRRRSFERFRTVINAAALMRLDALQPGDAALIVLSGRDLRDVPEQTGVPRFGTSGNRPAPPSPAVSGRR